MAILFKNSDLKKLTQEQFRTLGQLADSVQASTIDEPDEADRQAIADYCKQLQEKSAAEAQAQQALINSFI